jgi:hypothetical protein
MLIPLNTPTIHPVVDLMGPPFSARRILFQILLEGNPAHPGAQKASLLSWRTA